MPLKARALICLVSALWLWNGCGFNPKDSAVKIPSVSDKGTVECLYPDAGCHAAAGTWTDSWALAHHANGDNLPSFGYTDENCAGCHNLVEEGRNDSAYLFTSGSTGGILGTPERPIVGCEACHGAGSEHFAYAHADTADETPPTLHPAYDPAVGDSHYLPAVDTAFNVFGNAYHLASCGPCHSPDEHAGGSSLDNILSNQYPEWYGGDGPGLMVDDGHSDSLVVETLQGYMTSTVRGVPCAACHTVEGFVTFFAMGDTSWASSQAVIDRLISETGDTGLEEPRTNAGSAALSQVSCVSCHPSHEPGTLIRGLSGAPAGTGSRAALCLVCHNVRQLAADDGSGQSDTASLEIPRHPQKEVFQGVNESANDGLRGVESLPSFLPSYQSADSAHAGTANIPDACSGCHYLYLPEENLTDLPQKATTGHRFRPRLENCLSNCHVITEFLLADGSTASYEDSTIASFNFGSIYYSGPAFPGTDHDLDGTVEPLQKEIEGLLDQLKNALTSAGVALDLNQGLFDLTQMASRTTTERAAAYNYDFVVGDGSMGYHNPIYCVNLLRASISALP